MILACCHQYAIMCFAGWAGRHGTIMELSRNFYRTIMEIPRNFYGTSTEISWNFRRMKDASKDAIWY